MAAMNCVDDDDALYIALGGKIQDGKSILIWALQNLEPNSVRILHVNRPKVDELSAAGESLLRDIGEMERELMLRKMDNYVETCRMAGVNAIVLHKEKHNVEEGIVELVYQYSIQRLVMGAASDKHYSQGMANIRSRKARYVRQHAPVSCRFWFVCRDSLIETGKGDAHRDEDVEQRLVHTPNALYHEEMQRRKEAEEALAKEKEELTKTKQQRDNLMVECDNALRIIEDLLGKQAEEASGSLSTPSNQYYLEFSVKEIQDATQNFEPSLKISEGDYGSIYKGLLYHTPVFVKQLHQNPGEDLLGFQWKVKAVSKVRHPNLVTFMGACPELWALVFEYPPNGNLKDRLSCNDENPPLSWKTRIRIATELWSVLIFLHGMNPHGISYGHLDAEAILLDKNFACKLNCFDARHGYEEETSPVSDIHSFGVILLQLLTGRSSSSPTIIEEVKAAIEQDSLQTLLDTSGGGSVTQLQATQLAHLGLRCCGNSGSWLPDVSSEVTNVIEPLRAFCGASALLLFQTENEDWRQPPSYIIYPILQHVMEDPPVVADGFTYEADLSSGTSTSSSSTSISQSAPASPIYAASCFEVGESVALAPASASASTSGMTVSASAELGLKETNAKDSSSGNLTCVSFGGMASTAPSMATSFFANTSSANKSTPCPIFGSSSATVSNAVSNSFSGTSSVRFSTANTSSGPSSAVGGTGGSIFGVMSSTTSASAISIFSDTSESTSSSSIVSTSSPALTSASTGGSILGFSAGEAFAASSQSQASSLFGASDAQTGVSASGTTSSTQNAPFQFGLSASTLSFGFSANTSLASSSSPFGSSTSGSMLFSSTPTPQPGSYSSSLTNSANSSSTTTSTVFVSNWQTSSSNPIFGSSFNSSTPGFAFGGSSGSATISSFGSSAATPSSSSIFTFTTSTAIRPSQPIFGSSASAVPTPSQPVFGVLAPGFTFNATPPPSTNSENSDQMIMQDSMAEDTEQKRPSRVPMFGQPSVTPQPSFALGAAAPTPPPSGANPFQLGSQRNAAAAPQGVSPFQAFRILEFNRGVPGGRFSFGSTGGDKPGRRIVKINRNRRAKK